VGGEVVRDGRFLLDQRIIDIENEQCKGMFEVCCTERRSRSKPRKGAPPFYDPAQGIAGCDLDGDVQSWAASIIFQKVNKTKPPEYI
ncbi:hypothetical protein, partial [Halorubellus sp. PRR65]|uniref:hypothetical protein n=1 Tax=Halorubellus sp. PRR65 TaxID=3098148 RepID=UPI002B25BAD3